MSWGQRTAQVGDCRYEEHDSRWYVLDENGAMWEMAPSSGNVGLVTTAPGDSAVDGSSERFRWWLTASVGQGFHEYANGTAGGASVNFQYAIVVLTGRFFLVQRDATGSDPAPPENEGETNDLAVLVGLCTTSAGWHASLSAGVGRYGFSGWFLPDVGPSWGGTNADGGTGFAMQFELSAHLWKHVGIGVVGSANWNDFRDMYMLGVGISAGRLGGRLPGAWGQP
jgi:hypothetical protein